MILRVKVMKATGGFYNFKNPGIAEFNNLSGFNIYEMVVLAALVSPFKLGYVFPELMFYYKVTVEQQFNCII